MRDVDAIVLAGGLGTRLRSVVSDVPKVLAAVNGRPFLDILLEFLARTGTVRRVVLAVGYMAEQVMERYEKSGSRPYEIRFSVEDHPLGTGGAAKKAMALTTSSDVLILNGDSYLDLNVEQMLDDHQRRARGMTVALRRVDDVSRYGRVELDKAGKITCFVEKGAKGGGFINGGIYICRREVFDRVEPARALSIETDIFPRLAAEGMLFGFMSEGRFIDIGVPESYGAATEFFQDEN